MAAGILLLVLCLSLFAAAQASPAAIEGTWKASVGDVVFHGKWTAVLRSATPNEANGAWTLLNDSNDVMTQGSWSARNQAAGWQGTFTARAKSGGSYSGVWSAALNGSTAKSLSDMLRLALEKEVTGGWRSGRLQGYWRIQGSGR